MSQRASQRHLRAMALIASSIEVQNMINFSIHHIAGLDI